MDSFFDRHHVWCALFLALVLPFAVSAQSITRYSELDKSFTDYQVMEINALSLHQQVQSLRNEGNVTLKINDKVEWHMYLKNSNIIADDYYVTEATPDGNIRKYGTEALPMQGYVEGYHGSQVSLTFNRDFIYGFIKLGQTTYFIEPLYHYVKVLEKNKFVLYSVNDIIPGEEKTCGYDLYIKENDRIRQSPEVNMSPGSRMPGGCKLLKYATASDYSMVQGYGSSAGVQNHNIGVLNNVQTNYDDEFADQLQFQLNEQFVSTCATCDPWTSSTDSGVLLDAFTAWALGGFTAPHNLASLWSRRDFDGSTIGLAWVGVMCTSYRYHVLQDFTSNAEFKRVLCAHEMGHNLNASHNTGIMAPTVSNSTVWSSTSVSEINAHYQSASCLQNCPGGSAPQANFTYTQQNNCAPAIVQFTNQSTGASSYSWTFPGGTPATSTQQNPLVYFNTGGVVNVTLVATNSFGSTPVTLPVVVNILPVPVADFIYNVSGNSVSFIYTGAGATSYVWNFGDGSNTSSAQNPVHVYPTNGIYTVSLTIYNSCGSDTKSYNVEIATIPAVNFSSNVTSGCRPLTVSYTNLSNNATSYLWTFPGGTPATSTDANPTVSYVTPGMHHVTLQAFNNVGTNSITKNNYINVLPTPIADFTYVLSGATATFTNTGQYGTSVLWSFGDGEQSAEFNPVHTYAFNGVYTVTQTLTNSCGYETHSVMITIALPPVASFLPSNASTICTGQSISFENTSAYSPLTFNWSFEGGTPASATTANPIVTYETPGTFDVRLIVTNANGADTLTLNDIVLVNAKPSVDFSYLGDELIVYFNQNISNGSMPVWNFGDGQTSTDTNPIHTYVSEGNYSVTLTDENDCGITVKTRNIQVQLLPTAGFTADETTVCAASSVQFTSQSSPSVTDWLWTFEGGTPSLSTLRNPVVTYPQAGNYNVTLMVTNNSGQNTVTEENYVHVITAPDAACEGDANNNEIQMSNTSNSGSTVAWVVYNDDILTTLNGASATYTAPANGTYLVYLINGNQCGETFSDTLHFDINAYPESSFTANGGGDVCVDQAVRFESTSTNAVTFEWHFEGGQPMTSTDQNPVVMYSSLGNFSVNLITTNMFGSDTLTSSVEITTIPHADFTFDLVAPGAVEFEYSGSTARQLAWNFGDGNDDIGPNPTHTYLVSGTYDVMLIAQNDCGTDTITKLVSVIGSAADDISVFANIEIMPNPTSGWFSLKVEALKSEQCVLTISDVLGRILYKKSFIVNPGQQAEQIEISHLLDGMYILNLSGQNFSIPKKVTLAR